MKACAAGLLVNATAKSPAASTTGAEPLMEGNAKYFATVPTLAGSLSAGIVVATKLASYTIAEVGLALKTLSTEPVNGTVSAADGEPIRALSPQICLRVVSAVATVGSVHLIW